MEGRVWAEKGTTPCGVLMEDFNGTFLPERVPIVTQLLLLQQMREL